jgi:hypothetical protein
MSEAKRSKVNGPEIDLDTLIRADGKSAAEFFERADGVGVYFFCASGFERFRM